MIEKGKRTEKGRDGRCVCNGKEHGRKVTMGKNLRACDD